jgi:hypothetical protein
VSGGALAALAEAIRTEGGLLADTVSDPGGAPSPHGDAAAAGERAGVNPAEYALLVEAIREGYLQHYGEGRVLRTEDPDLALLAGDRLYALGLARLAELGDLDAVRELADIISLSAQAHAEERPGQAEAVWEQGAAAIGAGTSEDHEAAKAAWRGAQ